MDLADHFRVIWRRRWPVLLAAVAVAVLVFIWSYSRPSVYRAAAVVSITSGRAVSGEGVSEQDTVFLARNYAQLARTSPVLDDAALRSGLGISAMEVADLTIVSVTDDVGFLTISAVGGSRDAAAAVATAQTDALLEATARQQSQALRQSLQPVEDEILQLEARLAQLVADGGDPAALNIRYQALVQAATDRRLAPTDRLTLISPARVEPAPVSPTPYRSAAVAFIVALVVNAELAAVMYLLKDRFSTEEQDVGADKVAGLPVLGRVPLGDAKDSLEAFRALRTNLMFMDASTGIRTVAIVSADRNTGKTYTSVHLAESVADLEVPVVLIDAEMRRPSVHRYFGVDVSPGLGDLLAGASLDQVLRPLPGREQLRVVTGGAPVADPGGWLAAREFAEVLRRLEWAAMVLVDTPASTLFADALAIASRCDATLVVVDARTTRRQTVRSTVRQFRQVGANVIGLVLNRTEPVSQSAYGYDRAETAADA